MPDADKLSGNLSCELILCCLDWCVWQTNALQDGLPREDPSGAVAAGADSFKPVAIPRAAWTDHVCI